MGQCTALAGPLNGEIIYFPASLTSSYASGTVATLTCNLGFIASGQTTAKCLNGLFFSFIVVFPFTIFSESGTLKPSCYQDTYFRIV